MNYYKLNNANVNKIFTNKFKPAEHYFTLEHYRTLKENKMT